MTLTDARYVLGLFGTLLCVLIPVHSFKVTHLELPAFLDPREWKELRCSYDLGDHKLMTLRWFRDDEELMRYMPNNSSKELQIYNSPWLRVERGWCEPGACSLRVMAEARETTANTAIFRCEISSDLTNYKEDYKEDRIAYASPPQIDPIITGLPQFVKVGDQITVNCSTDYSWPIPQLTWYINDHLVRTNASKVGLTNSTLFLQTGWDILEFVITEEDLAGGSSLRAGLGASLDTKAKSADSAGVLLVRCQSSLEQFGKSRSTEAFSQTKSHALSSSLSSGCSIGLQSFWKPSISELLLMPYCFIISYKCHTMYK